MISLSFPSPVGEGDCNEFETYKPKVIHNLSTADLFLVDNPGYFIHSFGELSTISVDKRADLWIKVFGNSYLEYFYDYKAIWPVDKPVDKRGKICG